MRSLLPSLPLLLLAAPVTAQTLSRPQEIPPFRSGAPAAQGETWPAGLYLLFSPREIAPLQIPGIGGRLAVDPGLLGIAASQAQLDQSFPILTQIFLSTRTLLCQRFEPSTQGYALSELERFDAGQDLRFDQVDLLEVCRTRARTRLDEVKGTPVAPLWPAAATLGAVKPVFRPDVMGVAYFEFAVNPTGFILVATGEHDALIPHWSDQGPPPSVRLAALAAQQSKTVAKVYRVDALTYVGENTIGENVALLGVLPPKLAGLSLLASGSLGELCKDRPSSLRAEPFASWQELKQQYATNFRPLLRALRDRHADRWQVERSTGSMPSGDWSSWTTYAAGSSSEQPDYYQFTYGSCYVGCGPVAWAMLIGWGDYQAHDGNPYWAARTGLYRENGGDGSASSSAVAPMYLSTGIQNVIKELNGECATYCAGSSGATNPWTMDGVDDYLAGRTGATATIHYNSALICEDRLREYARDSIKDRGTPAVIGIGFFSAHYPLAWKYRWRSKDTWLGTKYDREFYVNMGWSGTADDGWIDASTWFAGELYP